MKVVHTLPLLIREQHRQFDLEMALSALTTLARSGERRVVLYNQGSLPNEELDAITVAAGVEAVVLGSGVNIGIAQARQACFDYIWSHLPQTAYISEVHVDMLFPPSWHAPLIDYLERSGEPMACPGILTASGELQPLGEWIPPPPDAPAILERLAELPRSGVRAGFVHPVIHRAAALRAVGGYPVREMPGKQGYEDDALLLAYHYYMGTRVDWRPVCVLGSWVYHATMAQRMSLPGKEAEFQVNERALVRQYGVQGLRRLEHIHGRPAAFAHLGDPDRGNEG
ncbi:hypothetical protein IDH44_20785 [Paenibacillus sp. IB182496]|uniref:Uncharacterized protein n=1 Tax=Paenibacillus sabuli TaxID=2772509 RepID=A0A927GTB0_9BACL|nr:hypothetical protein [Paenibacillus sabuli]MBD2847634.1 hypothetical protein [Paenibacillus sabuli]